jgi:tRNA (mo5U34)-methyltransferase
MYELDASRYLREKHMSKDDFQAEIANRSSSWFHRFDFTNGVSTPGRDPSAEKLRALALPDRLDALSVLDIGAYEGYFSFQAEARGAARVVAADKFVWTSPQSDALENFRFIKDLLGSHVEEKIVAVEDLSPKTNETFDVVLFLGVLYHAPNMMMYLERVRSVTKGMAVIETIVDMLDVDVPAAAFYAPHTLNNDASNYWGPNIACVDSMLERAGFERSHFVGIWEPNIIASLRGEDTHGHLKSGRAVWHAFA